jgi:ribosomal protein S18 acetylase RimI-like enzyme
MPSYSSTEGPHTVLIRPFSAQDEQTILDLTLTTFEPFYEGSFRPLMGEAIFAVQHADWREEYARTIPKLHAPSAGKYVDVGEAEGAVAGFVGWQVDVAREHGEISILAVDPRHRRAHVGQQLCEHAMTRMKDLGAKIVEIGTGGDPFHAPARRLYESLGCTQIPVAVYFKEL